MAVNPNVDFVAGAVLTASQQNRFGRGVMGYVVYNSGNISVGTGIADVTGASVTFTAVANRAYKVTFSASVNKGVTSGYFNWFITNGANVVQSDGFMDIVIGKTITFTNNYLVTGLAAGTQTLKMRALTDTGACTIYASGNNKYTFIVEDIGPI